jgi:hypothetical protein
MQGERDNERRKRATEGHGIKVSKKKEDSIITSKGNPPQKRLKQYNCPWK